MSERATVRPVTLGRLVEVTHVCSTGRVSTESVETKLDVSTRRARETILEAARIGLIDEDETTEFPTYETSVIGASFLNAVKAENWSQVSDILEQNSPHYRAFLETVETAGPSSLDELLESLEDAESGSERTYNQTSVDILSDWGERLGALQRNAFTGTYYVTNRSTVPEAFADHLLQTYDDLEQTAGVNLRQRYLSIPKLREAFCERTGCPRPAFDEALLNLAQETKNIGKLELSGAPIDTGAKESLLGIKEISLGDAGGLVSTTQSTDPVMAGVEQFGKQFYYLAVYDRDLTDTHE
ncbi:hypothetical protein [Haladaptatus sp. ZSTT2]|uniref:hypothetical protein n=1 Tax=Haladaptatus sp. ZSTT2 TaxID=3120515 RepID=UPI00300F137C